MLIKNNAQKETSIASKNENNQVASVSVTQTSSSTKPFSKWPSKYEIVDEVAGFICNLDFGEKKIDRVTKDLRELYSLK